MDQQDRNERGRNTPAGQRAQAGTAGRRTPAGQWPRSRARSGARGAALYPRFQFGHQRQLRTLNFLLAYQAQLDDQRNFVSRALESLSESVGGPTPRAYDTRGNYPGRGKAAESKEGGSRTETGTRTDSTTQAGSTREPAGGRQPTGHSERQTSEVVNRQEEGADSEDTENGDSDEGDDDADNEADNDSIGSRRDNPEKQTGSRARSRSRYGRDEPSSVGSPGARQDALYGALTKLIRHRGHPLAPKLGAVNRHLLGEGQRPADLDELNRAFARWRRVNPSLSSG